MKGMMMAGMSLMITMAMLMNKYMKGGGGGGGGGNGGNISRIFVIVQVSFRVSNEHGAFDCLQVNTKKLFC